MRVIRRFARQVAERFHPDKIILFGSYAYGTPHADSDVDILVIMPARNQIDQAVRIRWEVPARFPMDLIVRTPASMKWRLADGDLFHTEIVTKGKVLYEKDDKPQGRYAGRTRCGRRPVVFSASARDARSSRAEDGSFLSQPMKQGPAKEGRVLPPAEIRVMAG
jgi:predicted nucleotidyltransferase